MLTKKYPSTTRIVGIVLRSYIPNSGEMQSQPYGLRVLGKIVNVIADEKVLDEAGKIDAGKLQAFAFDQMQNGYYAIGEKVGQAWHSGADLMKK